MRSCSRTGRHKTERFEADGAPEPHNSGIEHREPRESIEVSVLAFW